MDQTKKHIDELVATRSQKQAELLTLGREIASSYLDQSDRARLDGIALTLTNYRFGVARYKRTKVLSWLTSFVLHPSIQANGELIVRSTAKQIDDMLQTVEDDLAASIENPLASRARLRDLVADLHRCLVTHSSCATWAGAVRDRKTKAKWKDNKDGSKWQELQLVASLVGVFLICAVAEDPEELLEGIHPQLLAFLEKHPRPGKTQNKTQWGFVGTVSLGMVELAGIDLQALEAALVSRYGTSCLPTLRAAAAGYPGGPGAGGD